MQILNYKYEADFTVEQISTLENWLTICCRQYNSALLDKINLYKKCKKNHTKSAMQTNLKNDKKSLAFLKDVPSQPLQETCTRVEKSFNNFFSKKAGFPKLKSRKHYNSLTFPQFGEEIKRRVNKKTGKSKDYLVKYAVHFDEDGNIYNTKLGTIKLIQHRPLVGKVKQLIIKKQNNKWFVIFSVERPANTVVVPSKMVGFDFGIKHFLTDSEGLTTANPKYLRTKEKQLKRAQRKLSRSKKGSANYQKQLAKLQKLHTKVSNQRRDFLHKQSCWIAQVYGFVAIEDLKIKQLIKSHKRLAKFINDSGWGAFGKMLEYKLENNGGRLVRVDPAYTTQDCSGCGNRVTKDLSVRTHHCASCGLKLDRDHNAAINILNKALAI